MIQNTSQDIAGKTVELLKAQGADLVGFADLPDVPAAERQGLPRAVAFAVALKPDVIASIRQGPTREYHLEYVRVNRLLSEMSNLAARLIQEAGFQAVASAATDEGVDPRTYSTRLPHKTVATRAALGWIGKCALLVTRQYGSAVRLNRVLTDAPLPSSPTASKSRCGKCRACVDACPAHAPAGRSWEAGLPRDEYFNAFACAATARELAARRTGVQATFCGICIAACPWTRRYLQRSLEPQP
jgi:epoxyqueuosine reductase QueG